MGEKRFRGGCRILGWEPMNAADVATVVEVSNEAQKLLYRIASEAAFAINHHPSWSEKTPPCSCLYCKTDTGIIVGVLVERLMPVLALSAACAQGLRATPYRGGNLLANSLRDAIAKAMENR